MKRKLTRHRPVMLRETLTELALESDSRVVDGTAGAGGHSAEILRKLTDPEGLLIGLDRDQTMLARCAGRLSQSEVDDFHQANLPPQVVLRNSSYADLPDVLKELGLTSVDRILVDLGLSSDQLADEQRGFGFQTEGLLDMRFDANRGEPVSDWLNRADVAEITKVLADFGEEPQAAAIAAEVVRRRKARPLKTVTEMVEVVEAVSRKPGGKSHPATLTFQALRIQANAELEHLQRFLTITAPQCLAPGGRLAVISFHSLEDRMTKQAFADRSVWRESSRKPLVATPLECKMNPRSRSAKLRIGIRAD